MSLGLDPDRFWRITPRLILVELDAAQLRQRRNEDMMLTAAWVSAGLQRASKMPKLKALLRRETDEKPDLRMYLDGMRAVLPSITMDEWRTRHSTRVPQSDSRKGGR